MKTILTKLFISLFILTSCSSERASDSVEADYVAEEYSDPNNITISRSEEPPAVVENTVLDELCDQLFDSSFGYNIPELVNFDDDIDIAMIINPSKTPDQMKRRLGGETVSGKMQVSRIVEAKLSSNDFEIQNITPERQVVFKDRDTVWLWMIKAKEAGDNKTVKISVTAIISVDGTNAERHIETYTNVIVVKMSLNQKIQYWFSKNWQWAWSALFIPLAGFFWMKFKK